MIRQPGQGVEDFSYELFSKFKDIKERQVLFKEHPFNDRILRDRFITACGKDVALTLVDILRDRLDLTFLEVRDQVLFWEEENNSKDIKKPQRLCWHCSGADHYKASCPLKAVKSNRVTVRRVKVVQDVDTERRGSVV